MQIIKIDESHAILIPEGLQKLTDLLFNAAHPGLEWPVFDLHQVDY
jgi:hypothetical protein